MCSTAAGRRGSSRCSGRSELAFADYSGNRQYITVGNLAENDRMFLLLLDYAAAHAAEDLGSRPRRSTTIPTLLEQVRDPDYKARVERVIRMRVEAWDTNCNSHIPHLVPARGRGCARWLRGGGAAAAVKATHLGIVAGLAMGPAVGLGLGRFAYALLLPAMRADLGWNYAPGGRDQHRQCRGIPGWGADRGADRRAARRKARLRAGPAC